MEEAERRQSTSDIAGEVEESQRQGDEPAGDQSSEPLLPSEETDSLRERWDGIQTAFVDEPQRSVQQADALVAEVLQQVAQRFSSERQGLEGQWDRGEEVSTEDLRQILQRYRSFFNRLLSA